MNMKLRHFWHSYDRRWQRRALLAATILPAFFFGTCVKDGGENRYHSYWRLAEALACDSSLHPDARDDLVDATAYGRIILPD